MTTRKRKLKLEIVDSKSTKKQKQLTFSMINETEKNKEIIEIKEPSKSISVHPFFLKKPTKPEEKKEKKIITILTEEERIERLHPLFLNPEEKKKKKLENFRKQILKEEKELESFVKRNKDHPFLKVKDVSNSRINEKCQKSQQWGHGAPIHVFEKNKESKDEEIIVDLIELEDENDYIEEEFEIKKFEKTFLKKQNYKKLPEKEPSKRNIEEEITNFTAIVNQKMTKKVNLEKLLKLEKINEQIIKENQKLWTDCLSNLEKEDFFELETPLNSIERFLEKWKKQEKTPEKEDEFFEKEEKENILGLTGETSTGKTSCIYTLARRLGFNIFEINSTFDRSYKSMINEFFEITQSHSINSYKEKVVNLIILIDDIDIGDCSISTIKKLSLKTKQPIIVTSSNFTKEEEEFMEIIELKKISNSSLKISLIFSILILKGFFYSFEEIKSMLIFFKGDIRRTLINLQFWFKNEGMIEKMIPEEELKQNLKFNNNMTFKSIELLSFEDSIQIHEFNDLSLDNYSKEIIKLNNGQFISTLKNQKIEKNLKRIAMKTMSNKSMIPSDFCDLNDFIYQINRIENSKIQNVNIRRRRFHYLEEFMSFQEISFFQQNFNEYQFI
eukprot:gene29-4280_t